MCSLLHMDVDPNCLSARHASDKFPVVELKPEVRG
jgi:hypothetical protein